MIFWFAFTKCTGVFVCQRNPLFYMLKGVTCRSNVERVVNVFILLFLILVLKVLGRGERWRGGDYMSVPGGGQKVRLLKSAIEEVKEEDKIILFIDR